MSVNQLTAKPTQKVTAAGIGAAVATLLLSLGDLADVVDLPTFWDTFITGVAAFASAYLTRAKVVEPPG